MYIYIYCMYIYIYILYVYIYIYILYVYIYIYTVCNTCDTYIYIYTCILWCQCFWLFWTLDDLRDLILPIGARICSYGNPRIPKAWLHIVCKPGKFPCIIAVEDKTDHFETQKLWHVSQYGSNSIILIYCIEVQLIVFTGWPGLAGWWFGSFFIFTYLWNVIIPIDKFIFLRGVGQPPTS